MSSQPNHDLTWYYFNYDSLLPQQMYKLISDYWIVTLFLFSETCVLKAFHLCHWWNNEMICYNFDNRKYTAKCKNWSLNYKKSNTYTWKKNDEKMNVVLIEQIEIMCSRKIRYTCVIE